jgi:hypothetical protein
MGGACSKVWESRGAYRVMMGKPEGVAGRAMLKWIFKKEGQVHGLN